MLFWKIPTIFKENSYHLIRGGRRRDAYFFRQYLLESWRGMTLHVGCWKLRPSARIDAKWKIRWTSTTWMLITVSISLVPGPSPVERREIAYVLMIDREISRLPRLQEFVLDSTTFSFQLSAHSTRWTQGKCSSYRENKNIALYIRIYLYGQ